MDRDLPVFNRLVIDKILKKNQTLHRERLKSIEVNSSKTMPNYTRYSLSHKKAQVREEEKKNQIDKKNRILLKKLDNIMKRTTIVQRVSHLGHSRKLSETHSRIYEENKQILSRLQGQKPTISHKKFILSRRKNLTLLKFLGKYPYPQQKAFSEDKDKKISKAKIYSSLEKRTENEKKFQRNTFQEKDIEEVNKHKMRNSVYQKNLEHVRVIPFSKNTKHIVLFEKAVTIHQQSAKVIFLRKSNEYQIQVHFDNLFRGHSLYDLTISQSEGNEFFSYFDYDYEFIAQMLQVEDGTLVVVIPKQPDQNKNIKAQIEERKEYRTR